MIIYPASKSEAANPIQGIDCGFSAVGPDQTQSGGGSSLAVSPGCCCTTPPSPCKFCVTVVGCPGCIAPDGSGRCIIQGAIVKLYADKGATIIGSCTTDSTGRCCINMPGDLTNAYYTIQAPGWPLFDSRGPNFSSPFYQSLPCIWTDSSGHIHIGYDFTLQLSNVANFDLLPPLTCGCTCCNGLPRTITIIDQNGAHTAMGQFGVWRASYSLTTSAGTILKTCPPPFGHTQCYLDGQVTGTINWYIACGGCQTAGCGNSQNPGLTCSNGETCFFAQASWNVAGASCCGHTSCTDFGDCAPPCQAGVNQSLAARMSDDNDPNSRNVPMAAYTACAPLSMVCSGHANIPMGGGPICNTPPPDYTSPVSLTW
jgi:hypothetical protein